MDESRIFTALTATVDYLKNSKLMRPHCLLSDDARSEFDDISSPEADPEMNSKDNEQDCVVIGLAPEKLNYLEMNRAFQ